MCVFLISLIPPAEGADTPRSCDRGEKKLSFAVSFEGGWDGEVNEETGASAQFEFFNHRVVVLIHESPGEASAIRLSLYDMLEAPLLEGEKYRLCFTMRTSNDFTLNANFNKYMPGEMGLPLQDPTMCFFVVPRGFSTQSCEFVPRVTTESDRFTFYLGEAKSGTDLEIIDMKLHILK
jgi:hypothetical protein